MAPSQSFRGHIHRMWAWTAHVDSSTGIVKLRYNERAFRPLGVRPSGFKFVVLENSKMNMRI